MNIFNGGHVVLRAVVFLIFASICSAQDAANTGTKEDAQPQLVPKEFVIPNNSDPDLESSHPYPHFPLELAKEEFHLRPNTVLLMSDNLSGKNDPGFGITSEYLGIEFNKKRFPLSLHNLTYFFQHQHVSNAGLPLSALFKGKITQDIAVVRRTLKAARALPGAMRPEDIKKEIAKNGHPVLQKKKLTAVEKAALDKEFAALKKEVEEMKATRNEGDIPVGTAAEGWNTRLVVIAGNDIPPLGVHKLKGVHEGLFAHRACVHRGYDFILIEYIFDHEGHAAIVSKAILIEGPTHLFAQSATDDRPEIARKLDHIYDNLIPENRILTIPRADKRHSAGLKKSSNKEPKAPKKEPENQ